MSYAQLIGVGGYLPEKIVTNHDLEQIVETSDEWITTRTGIKQRHIAAEDETAASMACAAAQQALTHAQCTAGDIDLIIVATCTPDYFLPSTACLVQFNLGIKRSIIAFDVSAACAGFIYALGVADKFIKTGSVNTALVIGSEVMSRTVDWTDRATCVLFGDGAGAVILRAGDQPGILSTHLHAQGEYKDLLEFSNQRAWGRDSKDDLHYLKMQGNEVFRLAVKLLYEAVMTTLKHNNLTVDDIDWVVPHQANMRIIQATAKRLGLPMERIILTVGAHGNTSAASVPLALHHGMQQGQIKSGDTVLLEAIGGGLTWGSVLIKV